LSKPDSEGSVLADVNVRSSGEEFDMTQRVAAFRDTLITGNAFNEGSGPNVVASSLEGRYTSITTQVKHTWVIRTDSTALQSAGLAKTR
jgi:hypothetical protein